MSRKALLNERESEATCQHGDCQKQAISCTLLCFGHFQFMRDKLFSYVPETQCSWRNCQQVSSNPVFCGFHRFIGKELPEHLLVTRSLLEKQEIAGESESGSQENSSDSKNFQERSDSRVPTSQEALSTIVALTKLPTCFSDIFPKLKRLRTERLSLLLGHVPVGSKTCQIKRCQDTNIVKRSSLFQNPAPLMVCKNHFRLLYSSSGGTSSICAWKNCEVETDLNDLCSYHTWVVFCNHRKSKVLLDSEQVKQLYTDLKTRDVPMVELTTFVTLSGSPEFLESPKALKVKEDLYIPFSLKIFTDLSSENTGASLFRKIKRNHHLISFKITSEASRSRFNSLVTAHWELEEEAVSFVRLTIFNLYLKNTKEE